MKSVTCLLLLLVGGFCVSLNMPAWADSSKDARNVVEVVVQGKQYKSIHAYKREQIRDTLKRALSAYNLMEFEEDELEEIMSEIRKQQVIDPPPKKRSERGAFFVRNLSARPEALEEDDPDGVASQMQEMLNQYSWENRSAVDIELDPKKVKSIIIKP